MGDQLTPSEPRREKKWSSLDSGSKMMRSVGLVMTGHNIGSETVSTRASSSRRIYPQSGTTRERCVVDFGQKKVKKRGPEVNLDTKINERYPIWKRRTATSARDALEREVVRNSGCEGVGAVRRKRILERRQLNDIVPVNVACDYDNVVFNR